MITVNQENLSQEIDLSHLQGWLNMVIDAEGKKRGQVTVILGRDDWLLDFNVRYLNHDYYTDIITFDYSEGLVVSGDILISQDRVNENADILNVSRETEMNRVVVHGVLHLCGYADDTDGSRRIMRKKEDYYINLL